MPAILNSKITAFIKENYRLCLTTKIEGVLVRVWKPLGAGTLPARDIRWVLAGYAREANQDAVTGQRARWIQGNPDYGAWDALTLVHLIPGRRTADVYFCAILCRPFSREAYAEYTRLSLLSGAGRRAVHPWDSRVFDRENGFVPVYTSAYDPCVAVTSGDIGENVPEDGQDPT